jgi:hypothetical protein
MDNEVLKIECAAIKDSAGKVWSVPRPGRHYNIIKLMRDSGYEGPVNGPDQQGFILSNGNFCRRKAAMSIAKNANQIIGGEPISSVLTTEDLW